MTSTPRSEKYVSDGSECPSSPPPIKGGHAPRGGKLARRARSFKDDFLDILAQMRSPSNPRSQSPHSPKSRASLGGGGGGGGGEENERSNPLRELDILVRQVQFALKHFRDVVSKNKLEMLPGNGTVVLDTITNIVVLLRNCLMDEQSSTLLSATSQLHQCVARLIRLCDDVVLYGSTALGRENVNQLVQAVQDAVQNLVSLARDKLSHKHNNNHNNSHPPHPPTLHLDAARASLPDIPLTPRERQILQQTSTPLPPSPAPSLNHSLSSESILQASPPPKPPLPTRLNDSLSAPEHTPHQRSSAPPLPPKRRHRATTAPNTSSNASLSPPNTPAPPSLGNDLGASSERLSVSPAHSAGGTGEDSSSLLSASKSGSLDSVLNQSRRDDDFEDDSLLCLRTNGNISPCFWGSSSRRESIDSPIFLSPHELLSLQEPPPTSLLPPGGTTRTLLNCSDDLTDYRHASMRTSSSSYMSQQSSVSYSSESSSFTSRSFSSSKRTLSAEQSATFASLAANLSMLSNGNSPPALPQKMRSRPPRLPSQYDNVSGGLSGADNEPLGSSARMHNLMAARETAANLMSDLMAGNIDTEPLGSSAHMMMACGSHHTSSCTSPSDGVPPPLPLKKKHIMAYMEMFGNCSSSAWSDSLMLRHSVHAYSAMQAEWARSQAEVSLSSTHSCLFASTSHSSRTVTHWPPLERVDPQTNLTASSPVSPPALPPKLSRTRSSASPPPPLPPIYVAFSPPALPLPPPSPVTPTPPPPLPQPLSPGIPQQPIYDFGRELPPPPRAPAPITPSTPHAITPLEPPSSRLSGVPSVAGSAITDGDDTESSPLEEMDVTQHLVFKKPEEEGPDIRGGHPDALIVQATKANKNEEHEADFLYQEAFLTTYRTFLSPLELTRKLQRRYERFAHPVTDHTRQRAARNAFSLLVRVVSDLTMSDLENELLRVLMDLIFHLLCSGDLNLARALRVKVLEKCEAKRTHQNNHSALLTSLSIHTRQSSLLDFKSEQVAEQMTLLDAELFMKIEIPEVLIWAQEQNEERSPNLTRFTEHFNKMSYWARSRILEQRDAKDRERYVVKFIKVMRHLRRANNFNSYLALLSALDSAPIRRLEWHRQITEGLKEYCALIDSSSSFRAYRQALAETQPPCIPYIGLVLQDLTFVHIGNSDLLPDGNINFSKRWQQFNIVENMKRFKKCQYAFKKQERILALFSNFDDCLCEEAMWQISETIKPRGGNANKK